MFAFREKEKYKQTTKKGDQGGDRTHGFPHERAKLNRLTYNEHHALQLCKRPFSTLTCPMKSLVVTSTNV